MSSATEDPNASGDGVGATLPTLVSAPRKETVAPAPERGALIGRYVVLSKLGAGAMGVVLAAYDPELDRKVALKLLEARGKAQANGQARLQREAQALAKLDHRNVVAVHDVGVQEGQLFVGMEFVEGQTLGEWMTSSDKPRPWREVVRVFSEAGRGLAAAHEAGMVHRDFKPDNVMLGDDGRVRVMDFGLARAAGEDEGERAGPVALDELVTTSPSELDSHLTQTGMLLGTPAYMSLEQLRGRPADARSDQFGFCVALYEALYGERPFLGPTLSALMLSVGSGEVLPAPKGSTVPAWLRRVVLRGLRPEADERWPSMDALLAALADDPKVRRRRWWAAAAVVGLLAGGAWGVAAAVERDAQTCQDFEAKLEGVWDDARRAEVEAAFEQTGVSYAADTWERVQPWLDEYTTAWVAAREEACEATHRGEQSEKLLDLRMACLDERLTHVRATVDVLARADEMVVKKAVQAVASLPRLDRCADIEALTADVPPPEDPEVARRVAELDEELAEADALQKAGKYAEGLERAEAVEAEATTLGYEPLQARAWLRKGYLQDKSGAYEEAEATLERAYESAMGLGMRTEAASASAKLIWVVGVRLARFDAGRRWAKDAKPLARLAGTDEAWAGYLNNLSVLAGREGKVEQARDSFERALAIKEKALGPEHPNVANFLNNLGNVALHEGKYEEARGYYERALAIKEKALGPGHPEVARSLNNLGVVARREGKYAEARDYCERALAIKEKVLSPEHPEVADSLHNLGGVALGEGNYEEARDYYERALAIKEKALGPGHPDVASSLNNLGFVALREGKFEQAHDYYERALAIREKALGPDHPKVAHALTGLGQALLGLGQPGEALLHLERAATLRTTHEGEPTELAETRFALARALWDAPVKGGRDRARAVSLAEQARAAFQAAGDGAVEQLEEVQAWQAQRGE